MVPCSLDGVAEDLALMKPPPCWVLAFVWPPDPHGKPGSATAEAQAARPPVKQAEQTRRFLPEPEPGRVQASKREAAVLEPSVLGLGSDRMDRGQPLPQVLGGRSI